MTKCLIFAQTNPSLDMSGEVCETAKKRHDVIFNAYVEVLSEHGEDAPYMNKKHLYSEVAKRTHYSVGYVYKIIIKKLRKKRGD